MSLLGILNLRSAPSAPWHETQLKVLNFLPSKAWKIGFIVGVTATFMYAFFCSKVMSFQATSGGPTVFASAGRTPDGTRRRAKVATTRTDERRRCITPRCPGLGRGYKKKAALVAS